VFIETELVGENVYSFHSIFTMPIDLPLDVRGSVHHSKIHKEKSNKMQQCVRILLLHIYMKLNMFQATHRPSSGA